MQVSGTLTLSTPNPNEVQMVRVFDAPRRLVFAALTQADLLKRWFCAMPGWSLAVCEIDARPGGTYRYVWHGPNGEVMGMGGTIEEIVAPELMVANEHFDQPWYEGSATSSIRLSESGGKTTLTLTVRYDSEQIRDAVLKFGATQGVEMTYDSLAAWMDSEEGQAAAAQLH